ncbi:peptidase S8/S53 domain-containing protein [Sporodiniella umbellata]|nr:peptidase S8/S53 domain-containing protein [Sporodiniella umbellata]
MLLSHHREFLTAVRKKKPSLGSLSKNETVAGSKDLSLNQINIGQDFSAVSGVFSDHAFLDYLYQQPTVEYVEPNQIYKTTELNRRSIYDYEQEEKLQKADIDSLKSSRPANWGLARINQRKKGDYDEYIFDSFGGNGVEVYVLDTGIFVDHLDFDARASHSANMIHHEDNNDMGGHGTHVAAKIAGQEYGVSKGATIRSVKILNKLGDGSTSTLLKGLEHVIKVAKPGKSLINLSLSGPRSRLVDDALDAVVLKHNIPIFASAGNAGTDACFFTPSSNPNVFSVGATDREDRVPQYSNIGECVSVYAPGSAIVSAYVGGGDSSKSMDGTSMASPHVSGTAANMLSKSSFRSVHDLYTAIRNTATKGHLRFVSQKSSSPNNNLLVYNPVL